MKSFVPVVALSTALFALGGCGQKQDVAPLDPQAAAIQDSSASESGMSQSLGAATQSLVDHATQGTPGDQPTSFASGGSNAGGMDRLVITATVDVDVVLENVLDAGGHRKYPNLSGNIHVHADGEVVNSWPTAAATMAHHVVTVTFDHVTYHDPECGATATLVSGAYTYDLDSDYHYTSNQNWTASFDAKLSVGSGTALVWTVSRPAHALRTVSLFGVRDAHLDLARSNNGGTVNRLVVDAQIDGTNGDGTTLDGVVGIDPGAATDSYTNWDFTVNGTDHLVWNRRAILHVQWDFPAVGPAGFAISGSDQVFLTLNGTKTGPYAADQLRAQFHCKLDD